MFENMSTIEIIKLLSPLIIIQFGLAIYCVVDILRKGVRNLSKGLWLLIVVFINLFGPILYLTLGRKKWQDD
jgi:hypothetical protein